MTAQTAPEIRIALTRKGTAYVALMRAEQRVGLRYGLTPKAEAYLAAKKAATTEQAGS